MFGTPNFSPNWSSSSSPRGGSQSSGFGVSRPGPNIAPNVHGTRSPQWSRWKCVITIEDTWGQPSCSRRRGNTPGPQSSSSRPDPSTTYPDCAPPGLGQAGEHPTTVSFTASVWHSPRNGRGRNRSPPARADLLRPRPEGASAHRVVDEGADLFGGGHRHVRGAERRGLLRDRVRRSQGERRRRGPAPAGGGGLLRRGGAPQRERAHGDDRRGERPQVLRLDVVGVPSARRDPRLHRLEAAAGDVQDVPIACALVRADTTQRSG